VEYRAALARSNRGHRGLERVAQQLGLTR